MNSTIIKPAEKPQKTCKRIEKLLADHKRLNDEYIRHKELEVSLKEQENQLAPTVKIDEPESFRKLADLRMRIDWMPRLIVDFKNAADNAKADLAEECKEVTAILGEAISEKFAAIQEQMEAALQPFYLKPKAELSKAQKLVNRHTFGNVEDVQSVVETIVGVTIPGATLRKIKARLVSSSFIERDPFKKAAELIEFGAVIDALKVVDNAKV